MYVMCKVPAKVGSMSLVGVKGKAPHSWGNYFDLYSGQRVANFWAENLHALVVDGTLEDRQVMIRDYGDYCLILDDRIPSEYYYNKLCFTGCYPPSIDIVRDMYETLGDPNNEIEQYENPKKYWNDRGWTWHSNGWRSQKIDAL